jgi:hypothetical protein
MVSSSAGHFAQMPGPAKQKGNVRLPSTGRADRSLAIGRRSACATTRPLVPERPDKKVHLEHYLVGIEIDVPVSRKDRSTIDA